MATTTADGRKVWDFCAAYRYTKPSGPIGSEGTTKCSHAFDVRGIYVHTACGQMAVAPIFTLPSELSAWGTGLPTCKACRKATGCD